jgi:hypothetical protein
MLHRHLDPFLAIRVQWLSKLVAEMLRVGCRPASASDVVRPRLTRVFFLLGPSKRGRFDSLQLLHGHCEKAGRARCSAGLEGSL